MKEKVMQGKPYAGNPHVRFDEGAGASRHSGRSALLYKPKTIRAAVAAALTIAASAVLPLQSFAGAKQTTLLCTGYTGTTTLTDFQTLVRLNDGTYGFHYADCATNDGTDVWFSSDPEGNNVLEREIDTWNTSGESFVWVKIPTVTPVSQGITSITMHWGDASKAQSAANTAVWSGYVGVWHMGKASGAADELDATGNGLDATPHASTFNNNNGNTALMVAVADGVIGGCRTNTTESTIGNALKVPSYKNKLNDFNTFTISGWFYQTASLPNTYRLFCSRAATTGSSTVYNGWELTSPDASKKPSGVTDADTVYRDCYVARVTSGKTSNFTTFQAATKVENLVNRWAHYCVTFEGTSMKAYVDGVKVNEGTITDTLPTANDNGFWIGRFGNRANPFIGKYDEVRMYNGVLSADRVKADYDTINAPNTFLTSPTDPIIAVWTGEANNNNFSDPGNWSCTNIVGGALSGAVPDANTEKYTLAADADWTSTNLTLAAGVTLDLNGHNLTVANITGGVIFDTTDGYIGTEGHNLFIGSDGSFYLEMEYLQSRNTNSQQYNWGTQYIDTGYRHNVNTVVDMKVAISGSTGDWYAYYGSRTGSGAQNQFAGWIYRTYHQTGIADNAAGQSSWGFTRDVPFLVHLVAAAAGEACSVDGHTFTHTKDAIDSGYNDLLFGVNQAGTKTNWGLNGRIYYCTIKEGETVKRDFVPVKRISDGKPGMLDKEHGVFYFNGRSSEAAHDFITLLEKKSATPASSSVTFSVAENDMLSLANVAPICGNVKVVKAGAGTLTVPTMDVYFTGGIDVSAGTLSIPGPVTSIEGSNLGNVTVASGAKVTIPATDGLKYGEAFTLNGGTLELVCSGTAVSVTTYITNSVALNAGAKIRFDTTALDSTQFKLSTTGFALGEGVASAVSCAELSSPTETVAEADGANGIIVTVLTEPATATYTGLGTNPLDFTDPDNWACTNAVGGALTGKIPTSNTAVTIPGNTAFQLASGGTMFDCLNVTFANVTFDDGADLRGFDFSKLASGSRIDLQGRTLYVANAAVSGLTITDSTGDTEPPGELHWTVASGTYTNDKTALSGNMKFVKEGVGTFVGAKAQTYTGDTIIAAGTARPPDGSGSNTTYCRDQFKAFGTGSIRVAAGATFDLRANYAYYGWVKLDGGTLTNSGNDMTGTTLGGSGIGEITADSTLNVAHHIVFQGNTFNLNGHTLNVTIPGKHWYIHTTTFTNGTVNITQGGWLHTVKNAIDAHTVDFKMNCAIHLEQNLDVRNYEALWNNNDYNRGNKNLNVHGTFKPASFNYFYGCTLLDGSTIDLTNRTVATLPMPTTAAFTGSKADGKKTLSFATGNENGTTVTVAFGGKTKEDLKAIAENEVDGKTGMLLTWTSEPAADVKFKADAATSALGFKVKRVEGGVRLLENKGLMIIIQ